MFTLDCLSIMFQPLIGFSHWLHGSIRQVIVHVFLQYQPRTFEFKPDPGVVMGASS